MTAVTAENTADLMTKQLLPDGYIVSVPVQATTTIYKNTFVGIESGLTTPGYLVSHLPRAQVLSTSGATGNQFFGLALENVDNSTGAAGAKMCEVQVSGFFRYCLGSAAQLDLGKPVYALDNATLTKIGVNNALIGTIVSVPSAGYVVVDMLSPTSRCGVSGGTLSASAYLDVGTGTLDEVYLTFPSQNHNGLVLIWACAHIVEAFVTTDASAVVTLCHTLGTNTSLGCTMTCITAGVLNDLVIGVGGGMNLPDAASADNLIAIPADVATLARISTVCSGGAITGMLHITAEFQVK